MILMEVHTQDWRVDLLRQNQFPFVMVGRTDDNEGLEFIDMDFENATAMAMDYLYHLGHREISLVSISLGSEPKTYGPALRSLAGYEKIRQMYNLDDLFFEVLGKPVEVENFCVDFLKKKPDTTAIITISTMALLGVMGAIRTLRLDVPADLSVIALASDPIAQLTSPSLTTIHFPSRDMGYAACNMLIDRLEGKSSEVKQILIPTGLIVRELHWTSENNSLGVCFKHSISEHGFKYTTVKNNVLRRRKCQNPNPTAFSPCWHRQQCVSPPRVVGTERDDEEFLYAVGRKRFRCLRSGSLSWQGRRYHRRRGSHW